MIDDSIDLAELIRSKGNHCLILARHGETEWNARGRLQGQQDIELNTRGRSQANAVAHCLRDVPVDRIHTSVLRRCRQTARLIAVANVGRPDVVCSDLLKETALGVLEGESKDRQSTEELARHYEDFSRDEIHYRVPGGENLHDVYARVQRFFSRHSHLVESARCHLIVGHRNVNKMVVKHLLELSFDEGFRVEQENQRIYLWFGASTELWSCWVDGARHRLARGFATTTGASYA
jgi:broad specificity phosphatase PhoE